MLLLRQFEQQRYPSWQPVHEMELAIDLAAFQAGSDVHVWRVDVGSWRPTEFAGLLAEPERQRAQRFRSAADRQRYEAAHAALRLLASAYTGVPAEDLDLRRAPGGGKPYAANLPPGIRLYFNMSHAGDIAVYSFANGCEVGIDVEYKKPGIDWMSIAERCFAPREQTLLASVAPERRQDAFYYCWTRTEALLKTVGVGLAGLEEGERAASVATFDREHMLLSFLIGAEYQCGMSVSRSACDVNYFHYMP